MQLIALCSFIDYSKWMFSHLIEHAQGVVIIRLQGRLDQSGCDMLAQVLDRHATNQAHVVLDMRDVDYLSSATIGLLAQIARDTPPNELRLALAAVQPHVRESLELSHLKKLLPIYKTIEEALPVVATPALVDNSTLSSNRARELLLRYLMLIQYGELEHLEDFVHIDVSVETITPYGVKHTVDIHALRIDLNLIRREGGIDIEIATIVAQPDAVSAWIIERTASLKANGDAHYCALFAHIRSDRIGQLRIIRGASMDCN